MKKNSNPFLVAGIFASLIFIVNCNSAGSHGVKATMPAQKLDRSNLPPCTPGIMTLIAERKVIVDDLNKKISEAQGTDLDADHKAALNTAIDNLRKKSNDIYKDIKAIKGSPLGCNSVVNPTKKQTYAIEDMRSEN